MWKAIKESKWYWYIPIVSFIFFKEMTNWEMSGKTLHECMNRNVVCIIAMIIIQSFALTGIMCLIFKC
jgi:hypothetical protein